MEKNDIIIIHGTDYKNMAKRVLEQAGVALDTGSRLRLLPGVHSTDGFFAAVLTRTPPVNEQEVDEQENEPAEAVETAGPTDESE